MPHPINKPVSALINRAVPLMDAFMRDRIDVEQYAEELNRLDVDSVMVAFEDELKKDARLVYYLDALMILSSLQHELHFQVAEYGANVAKEDMRNLQELAAKFPKN
jgi:hypothetical protein